MMELFCPFILTSDKQFGSAFMSPLEFQQMCMYQTISKASLQSISAPEYVCGWPGVECTRGRVTSIQWFRSLELNIQSLNWLPSTLKTLRLTETTFSATIQTRLLPIYMLSMDIRHGNLHGSIEMRTLPPKIENLRITNTSLSGTVNVTSLPETLVEVNLSGNRIDVIVGSAGCLPEGLVMANFSSRYGEHSGKHYKRKLRPVRYISLDGNSMDKRIKTTLFDQGVAYQVRRSRLPFRREKDHAVMDSPLFELGEEQCDMDLY